MKRFSHVHAKLSMKRKTFSIKYFSLNSERCFINWLFINVSHLFSFGFWKLNGNRIVDEKLRVKSFGNFLYFNFEDVSVEEF